MNRRHDIDALRVLAFGLLIVYHLGMLYVGPADDWKFHLKSSYIADWLAYPMIASAFWRMDLLFLISGMAVHFLRGRLSLPALAWKRTTRLLLPLLFGMAVVIPIQPYVQGVVNGLVAPGFGHFLLRYWTGGPWPAGAFDGWQFGVTWNHLWYLPYVWLYTMLLIALLPALESSWGQRVIGAIHRLRGWPLLVLPALPLLAYNLWLAARFPQNHAMVGDWYAHACYATMFFYGYAIGTHAELWDELARLRRRSLGMAVFCFAAFLLLDRLSDLIAIGGGSAPGLAVGRLGMLCMHALRFFYMWSAIAAVLGWGHQYLNRPFRWLPYAREAVFPWYVLHQSVMLAAAYWLLPLKLGPVLEPTLVLAGTVVGCAALHEYVIRRTRWLRPLFGLDAVPRAARREPSLTASTQGA
ncbi:acyltransferase family protein [Dyella japonica]|uniref:Membrane protein n=1 Tax=Dyella japonica A8 TaxID=1217721 RepID=A0A075JX98_9GAMM|nr:acyltransferase [Dyella japonica]AIF46736.1 membrane protein [Dyella japonica A8]